MAENVIFTSARRGFGESKKPPARATSIGLFLVERRGRFLIVAEGLREWEPAKRARRVLPTWETRLGWIRPVLAAECRTAERLGLRARRVGVLAQTLRGWLRRYDEQGIAGLRTRPSRPVGGIFRSLSALRPVVAFVTGRFQQGTSYVDIHRALLSNWDALCPGVPKPETAHTANRLVRAFYRAGAVEVP